MPRHVQILLTLLAVVAPVTAAGVSRNASYEQDFIITAYYSPLPGQCCYVTGGYRADKVLNGEGVKAADGTEVYPGMVAAPASYPFGTVIALPGMGKFAVHDRGGAIQELDGGVHRLDIWVGYGEEGLARALAFGVQRVRGTIYPVGGRQPKEEFSLDLFPAVLARLKPYLVTDLSLLAVQAKAGDQSYSVELLQRTLKDLGYFTDTVTGFYGAVTQGALQSFNTAYALSEPADHLTERSAASLMAASRRQGAAPPVVKNVEKNSPPSVVRAAQRTLRFFGFYKGRTSGEYDDNLYAAILMFQQKKGLVGTEKDPGAGRIGPLTRGKMRDAWDRRLVTAIANRLLTHRRVEVVLDERGKNVDRFLEEGDSGDQVALLQRLLADRGFFPEEKINGNFGELTKAAVLAYQLKEELIKDAGDAGAGTVGPQTLMSLRSEQRRALYLLVRKDGWRVL